jgi:exonuclease III
MGDFNSTPKNIDRLHPNNTPPFKIYTYLPNYLDTFRLLHPNKIQFSYKGPTNESRIDQIWSTTHLATNLTNAEIIPTETEFKSDHKITTITLNNFLPSSNKIKTKT